MAEKKGWYTYVYKVGNKIKHGGITQNLKEREKQHQQKWPSGHIEQVGEPKTEGNARRWERRQGYG
jgi:predicted GIY-YIG superfamily endonuclease